MIHWPTVPIRIQFKLRHRRQARMPNGPRVLRRQTAPDGAGTEAVCCKGALNSKPLMREPSWPLFSSESAKASMPKEFDETVKEPLAPAGLLKSEILVLGSIVLVK